MREQLYRLLRRTLSQTTRTRLKRRLAHARRRLAPLYRVRHGTFTADELVSELRRRVPADFEILMVHCSLNDLQPAFVGSAGQLLDALATWCGPNRTLAMPAFFFGGPDADPAAYYRERPAFDVRRQPSQMGLLSELFRRRRQVRRSLHPTSSICALGPLADELVEGHHCAETTFGDGTPFARMAAHKTAIVGIGTEYFRCLTQVHAAEDLLGDRYPIALRPNTIPVELKDIDGNVQHYRLPVKQTEIPRRLQLLERLMDPEELVQWRFHGVALFVTSAARVTDVLVEAALRGETLYDPMPIRPPQRDVSRACSELPRGRAERVVATTLRFHHLGIATTSLEKELRAYEPLGYEPEGGQFVDEGQGIRGLFLIGGGPRLELLEPLPGSSTLTPLLRRGIKCYHNAYEVQSMEESIDALRQTRARVTRTPAPAPAFNGRRIAFLTLPNGWMVELIEDTRPSEGLL